ncbi:hypothetical protein T459_16821 [Capsicum annuum]|uniref:Uncharacterized protein n=1 Tax=Capsicum annuum TaxID=4072 RepID=A0A2G2Z9X5_CAPAN|nr:hypothetical protein FXO37_22562 [Capsicum annuum]PHT78769.1 hypothetical protein T459_16821 [Capsicum annuum]
MLQSSYQDHVLNHLRIWLKGPKIASPLGYLQSSAMYSLPSSPLSLLLVFAKKVEKRRGKRKELSPQDAVLAIQMNFRAYLIRRSQPLCALRELAIAKTKLKELRALFNNFTYRQHIGHDAEE